MQPISRCSWSMWHIVVGLALCTGPTYSVLDLKANCHGYKYVEETINKVYTPGSRVAVASVRGS
jgi:hypothetical protein